MPLRTPLLVILGALGCSGDRTTPRPPAAAAPPTLAAATTAPATPPPAKARPAGTPGDLRGERLSHRTPYIPPQCYTKTRDEGGRVVNPCFTCHQDSTPPNYVEDAALQLELAFPPAALRNPWTNLFVDRRAAIAEMPDAEILAYVRQDNYHAPDGSPALAATLARVPAAWDVDKNGRWGGWVPDVAFRFDERGFDVTPEGRRTGWRAYAYYPLPGAFWPTNGSFGDALIRLPAPFREDAAGRDDVAVYVVNLAILEALITRRDVAIAPTDERKLGVDLDGDGRRATARRIRYTWRPGAHPMRWVGRAGALQKRGELSLAAGLFPVGTEIAHTLRYLDVVDGRARMAARMKELRYMVKKGWLRYGDLASAASREALDAEQSPNETRAIGGSVERGIGNGAGWRLQAFIEDAGGALRPQSREEHAFCVGCHSGVGATDDSVFSFGRKLPATEHRRGWYHPSQRGLEGLDEPRRADGEGEYAHYLRHAGGGDELRANDEVLARFFAADGNPRPEALATLRSDVAPLLVPSAGRALALNKAYRLVVQEQSYARGRDAVLAPALNVHRELQLQDEPLATGVARPLAGPRARPARGAGGAAKTPRRRGASVTDRASPRPRAVARDRSASSR